MGAAVGDLLPAGRLTAATYDSMRPVSSHSRDVSRRSHGSRAGRASPSGYTAPSAGAQSVASSACAAPPSERSASGTEHEMHVKIGVSRSV